MDFSEEHIDDIDKSLSSMENSGLIKRIDFIDKCLTSLMNRPACNCVELENGMKGMIDELEMYVTTTLNAKVDVIVDSLRGMANSVTTGTQTTFAGVVRAVTSAQGQSTDAPTPTVSLFSDWMVADPSFNPTDLRNSPPGIDADILKSLDLRLSELTNLFHSQFTHGRPTDTNVTDWNEVECLATLVGDFGWNTGLDCAWALDVDGSNIPMRRKRKGRKSARSNGSNAPRSDPGRDSTNGNSGARNNGFLPPRPHPTISSNISRGCASTDADTYRNAHAARSYPPYHTMTDDSSSGGNLTDTWIYLSGFYNGVTSDDVRSYACNRLNRENISCFSLLPRGADPGSRQQLSFKLKIPSTVSYIVLDGSFWPDGVRARKFVNNNDNSFFPSIRQGLNRSKPDSNAIPHAVAQYPRTNPTQRSPRCRCFD